MNKQTTFDALPEMVADLGRKLDLLIAGPPSQVKADDYHMTMEDLRDYLPENPARQTVYGWVHKGDIPHEKHGRRLYFRKYDIDSWIAKGRPKRK